MNIKPHFSSIRKNLIETLEKAEIKISAAVCWFTNDDLFNLLCRKLKSGVLVELIILDDYINANPFGCDFSKFVELGGHLYLGSVERPMHNKYCIIDNEILINGSYNWTYYAETKNEENIIIFENCPNLIAEFSSDFDRIKSVSKATKDFKKKSLLEFENAKNEDQRLNVFSSFNILSHDLFFKAVSTNKKMYYEAARSITPDNIVFQEQAIKLNWEKSVVLKSTLGEEVKDDKLSIIFKRGTSIPAKNKLIFSTIKSKQVEASMAIFAGESGTTLGNLKIGSYKLSGIPELNAGEGKIVTEYKISTTGILYVTNYIHDTGLIERRTFDLNKYNLFENE